MYLRTARQTAILCAALLAACEGADPSGSVAETDPDAGRGPEAGMATDADATAPDGAPPVSRNDSGVIPPAASLRLNEIDCRGRDHVELVNAGDTPLDLDGWTLTDAPERPDRGWPLRGHLRPGEHLVLAEARGDEEGFTFGIACGDDTIHLLAPDGSAADVVEVPELPAAFGWGRLPDGHGPWAPVEPTLGAPNLAPVDYAAALFDPAQVFTVELAMAPEDRARLTEDPRAYVPATLTVEAAGERHGPLAVGLRLKGGAGSFRPLDEKPAFKVDVNFADPAARLLGLKKLTLNNLIQDPTLLREWTTYTLMHALGIPTPRVGYAWVRVDDEDYGIYAHIESPDDVFLDRWFPSTAHLYEGYYGHDLRADDLGHLEVDEGDPADTTDVRALVDLLDAPPPEGAYATTLTNGLVRWPEAIAMMAAEVYLGHWDGYSASRNNYRLHFDDGGQLTLLPWGADQSLVADLPADLRRRETPPGRLYTICLDDPTCRRAYGDALARVLTTVDQLDLPARRAAIAATLRPFAERDPRRPLDPRHPADAATGEAARRTDEAFLRSRHEVFGALVECLRGPDPDHCW